MKEEGNNIEKVLNEKDNRILNNKVDDLINNEDEEANNKNDHNIIKKENDEIINNNEIILENDNNNNNNFNKENLKNNNNIELNKWMSKLNDNIKISELSIPGSHDSGTYKFDSKIKILKGFIKTQNIDILEQLNKGIRFLDIRTRINKKSEFDIYHSTIFVNINFDDVLNQIFHFLKNNNTEFIFFMLQNEGGKGNFFFNLLIIIFIIKII
jgi:hypothetical protein